jgi:hypothetical protein
MNTQKKIDKKIIPLLRNSVNILFSNPAILFPFMITAFIQLFILEILYFSPRYPLNIFFGPIIRYFSSEKFLHYPYNFEILPKIFHDVKQVLFVLVSSFLVGIAINTIAAINNDRKSNFRTMLKETAPLYIYIILSALVSLAMFTVCSKLNDKFLFQRALMIRSESGVFFWIKMAVLKGAPFINLLTGIFVTTLFAYFIPTIVIKRKNVLTAFFLNFKTLFGSFWFTFIIVFIPSLLFVPFLLLNMNINSFIFFPELRIISLTFGIIIMTFIDAVIFTALTTYYLLKENQ